MMASALAEICADLRHDTPFQRTSTNTTAGKRTAVHTHRVPRDVEGSGQSNGATGAAGKGRGGVEKGKGRKARKSLEHGGNERIRARVVVCEVQMRNEKGVQALVSRWIGWDGMQEGCGGDGLFGMDGMR